MKRPQPGEHLVAGTGAAFTLARLRTIFGVTQPDVIGLTCPDCRSKRFLLMVNMERGTLLIECTDCGAGKGAFAIAEADAPASPEAT